MMWVLASGLLWDVCVGLLIARAVIQSRHYGSLGTTGSDADRGSISVIVPARNEAANIESCVRSLLEQTYPEGRWEILVVDDHSEDDTAELVRQQAARDGRVRLITGLPLPPGWTGKTYACWQGARAARGDWLCFMDADTTSRPALLSAAVDDASRRQLGMLSLVPRQLLGSVAERLLIPAGALVVAFTVDLREINGTDPDRASANGQFLLFPREVYFALGGHRQVREEICEDRALARLAKRAGHRCLLLGAEELISVRMYRSFRDLWDGFSKNITEMLGGTWRTACVAGGMAAFGILACCGPIVAWSLPRGAGWIGALAATAWLAGSATLLGIHTATAIRFGVPWWYGPLFPLSHLLGAALAVDGIRKRRAGSVRWKGRTCGARSSGDLRPRDRAPESLDPDETIVIRSGPSLPAS